MKKVLSPILILMEDQPSIQPTLPLNFIPPTERQRFIPSTTPYSAIPSIHPSSSSTPPIESPEIPLMEPSLFRPTI